MTDEVEIPPSKKLTLFNPAFIDDYGFTPEEFRVFARIMRYSASGRVCFETVPNMADRLGMGERSVRRALQVLTECGAITVTKRPGATALIVFNESGKWVPSARLYEIRERLFGAQINKDRERKITPVGNATPVGNDRGTPVGNDRLRYTISKVHNKTPLPPKGGTRASSLSPSSSEKEYLSGRPRGLRGVPATPEAEVLDEWMEAVAGAVGAKSAKTMASAKGWSEACASAIREGRQLSRWLEIIKAERERTRATPHFFTPHGCLKVFQSESAKPERSKFYH